MIDITGLREDKRPQSATIVHALLDRLEAAEKERDSAMKLADRLALALNTSNHERDNLRAESDTHKALIGLLRAEIGGLRAKITEMERQEPVAFGLYSGWDLKATYLKEHEACEQRDRRQLTADLSGSLEAYRVVPLYAIPGAQNFADAYQGAMEEVAIWKKRALEAENLNRKFIAEINGPTHMGEPVQNVPSVPAVPTKSLKPVIDWLRNGCDPMRAADELELLIAAALKPEAKP